MQTTEILAVMETMPTESTKPSGRCTKATDTDFRDVLRELIDEGTADDDDKGDAEVSEKEKKAGSETGCLHNGLGVLLWTAGGIGIVPGENAAGLQPEDMGDVNPFGPSAITGLTDDGDIILPRTLGGMFNHVLKKETITAHGVIYPKEDAEDVPPSEGGIPGEEREPDFVKGPIDRAQRDGTDGPGNYGFSVEDEKVSQNSFGEKPVTKRAFHNEGVIGEDTPKEHPFAKEEGESFLKPSNGRNDPIVNRTQRDGGPKIESVADRTPRGLGKDTPMVPVTEAGEAHHSHGAQTPKGNADTVGFNIANEIAERVKVVLNREKPEMTEISIQLKPESLGRLRVSLTVADGVLNGRVIVQNSEARDLLRANIERLQENLEQQGIALGKFHINMGGGYNQQQFTENFRQGFHGRQDLGSYEEEDEKKDYIFLRGEGTIELLA